jgi:hypothetical protein
LIKQPKFSLHYKDSALLALVKESDHVIIAAWSIACVQRVLPYFEEVYPHDDRPQTALDTLQAWIETSQFSMKTIRRAALAAHAAAREVGTDTPARSAARAAGQAVATAHVTAHAIAASNYALQAIYRAHIHNDPDAAVAEERAWQYQHLADLRENS